MKDLDETREELLGLKTKHKAAVARRDTLENLMKEYKTEVASKMRILIEKTGEPSSIFSLCSSFRKR